MEQNQEKGYVGCAASQVNSPLPSTPHKTTVVSNLGVLATLATRDMPAKCCGTAALDGGHDFELSDANVAPVRLTPRGTVVAQDVRDLQRLTSHGGLNRLVVSAPTSDARAGSPRRAGCGWPPGCKEQWSPTSCARAGLVSRGYRRPARASALQSCA